MEVSNHLFRVLESPGMCVCVYLPLADTANFSVQLSLYSCQSCKRFPVVPHPHQHLVLAVFINFSPSWLLGKGFSFFGEACWPKSVNYLSLRSAAQLTWLYPVLMGTSNFLALPLLKFRCFVKFGTFSL